MEKILVPLDGSTFGEGILPYLETLAPAFGARVTLVHVICEASRLSEMYLDLWTGNGLKEIEARTKDYLARTASRLQERGVSTATRVLKGRPAENITRFAQNENFGLIAMSTHGQSGQRAYPHGSMAEKVLHSSITPLFLARPPELLRNKATERSLTTVLIPLDGSQRAEIVLPLAEELAKGANLHVILLHVVSDPWVYYVWPAEAWRYSEVVQKHGEEEACAYLEKIATSMRERGLDASPRVLRGDPAARVIDLAVGIPGCVIALASHGRTGLVRWALGSVAEKLVKYSQGPLLIAKAAGQV